MNKTNKTTFRNCLEEFLNKKVCIINNKIDLIEKIECVLIKKNKEEYRLNTNFTIKDFENFMKSLEFICDYNYTDKYEGTIWFDDGSWAVFQLDYDCLYGFWTYYKRPSKPIELLE